MSLFAARIAMAKAGGFEQLKRDQHTKYGSDWYVLNGQEGRLLEIQERDRNRIRRHDARLKEDGPRSDPGFVDPNLKLGTS